MSEPGLPPPLPPFAQPIPVQPIPVQAIAAQPYPPPGQPADYDYGYGYSRRRPGIITAIAILSITIGSLGIITGGLSALYGGMFYFIARQTVARSTAVAVAQAAPPPQTVALEEPTVNGDGEPTVGERGLDVATRQLIINLLASQRPLSDARRHQLHALLAKCGQDAFLNSGGNVTPDDIRRSINQSGQLPRAADSDPTEGPDFFVLATGRIEVSDDRALFEPSDHSQETIRVSAPLPAPDANAAAGVIAKSGISKQDVEVAVRYVNQQVGHRLTSQQRQTLTAEFSSAAGLLRPSSPGAPIASQLLNSIVQPGGAVLIMTANGQIQVSPTGVVQSRLIYGNGVATTSPAFAGPLASGTGPSPISAAAATWVVAEGAVSVLLSIYLLVIGILTLRQTPRGRRLHIIYALLKIPLAILCGIGWCWFVDGFLASMPNAGGNGQSPTVRAVVCTLAIGVAILYPLGLLITFCTPTVKRYYDSGQS